MMTSKEFANGGYCRLRVAGAVAEDISNEEAIVVGSISTANSVPSTFETYFSTNDTAQILLEHQSGNTDQVKDIALRANPNNSRWHIFARICISRV